MLEFLLAMVVVKVAVDAAVIYHCRRRDREADARATESLRTHSGERFH